MRGILLACLAAGLALQAQPAAQRFTLPNGLQVVHQEDHERPLVRVRLHLRIERGDTPPDRQGLPLLAMRMFVHSDAADLKAEAFDRLLEDSGLQLEAISVPGGFEWSLVARSRDQDRGLGLLADRLLRTIFDPMVLEAQRLACWRQEEGQDLLTYLRLQQVLVQDPATRPSIASLGAITLEDLLTFRAKVFRPDRAVLVIHGDVGLEQAKRLVLLSLGSWTTQELPQPLEPSFSGAPPTPAATPASQPRILATGAGFRIQTVSPRPVDLQPEAFDLLSLLIPGESALFPVSIAIRQDDLVTTLDAGTGTTWPEAWSMLQDRLAALRQRGFSPGELDQARSAWLAGRRLASLSAETQMTSALIDALGRGTTPDRMRALTLDQLNAALRVWLDPRSLRSGTAGGAELLRTLPTP